MAIYENIEKIISEKGAAYFILIDPDKIALDNISEFVTICEESDVDGFLVGGSLLMTNKFNETIKSLKEKTKLPIIIFPGGVDQISSDADAILFLSLVSSRNAEHLIGKHVLAAPIVKQSGIEPISTGYILVESGKTTTAEYISGSKPIPRNKPEIAAATALAAEYLGMKFIYLEGGSGAEFCVPNEVIKAVSDVCTIPIIVGGGLKEADTIKQKVNSGAQIIVTGNYFEDNGNWETIRKFADAVHFKKEN